MCLTGWRSYDCDVPELRKRGTPIGVSDMGATENEATVRRWVDEAWNSGRIDGQRPIFSPAYTWAELPAPFGTGSTGLMNFVGAFRAAFPDLHFNIEDVVSSGDKVVWRATGSGTQRG